MKRLISKLIIAALVAGFACSSVFAASAKVTYVKGKVEVSRGSSWVSLKVGDVVNEAETIRFLPHLYNSVNFFDVCNFDVFLDVNK